MTDRERRARTERRRAGARAALAAALAATMVAGCGRGNRLAEYSFRDLTLAVLPSFPPYPEVLTGPYFPDHPENPIHAIIRAGSRIAKEVEARRVRARLDSAAARVDVPALVTERVAARATRTLGTRLVDTTERARADLLFEVEIRDYGIDAEEWDAAARFFVDAEAWLLDGGDRRVVWRTRVKARDPITPAMIGQPTLRDVVTAAVLSELTVEDIARALDQLAYYAADRVTDRLRSDLERARSRR